MCFGSFLCDCQRLHSNLVIEVAEGKRVTSTEGMSAFNGEKVGYMTVGEALVKYGARKLLYMEFRPEDAILFLVTREDEI